MMTDAGTTTASPIDPPTWVSIMRLTAASVSILPSTTAGGKPCTKRGARFDPMMNPADEGSVTDVERVDTGGVQDPRTALERPPHRRGIGDVAHDVFHRADPEGVEGAGDAPGRADQQPHRMPGIDQRLDAVRPDEPGSTGHEHLHRSLPRNTWSIRVQTVEPTVDERVQGRY